MDDPEVPRGTMIRRFVVLDRIGAGATGVVYAAFDYNLDRKIAIKLVRGDHVLQEAQALARLSHRNVVAVYDVGTFGDRVFIAMEHVDGVTLREWLATRRPIGELVATLIDAGRGLAAAHAAGLVHGDFKPENVLVDRTGRCVVIDFGLAGPAGGERRGGSLAYMAAELHAGPPTAASDQFSFCVTLYEACYGERPFAGDGAAELARAIAAGELREPPPGARVPARLRAAIVRGLAVAPGGRWPSVAELCAAIAPSPRRRNAIVLAAAVTAAAGLGVGATALVGGGPGAPDCSGGDERVAAVWTPARRATLRARLSAPAFERAAARLDGYTGEWSAMHGGACRATVAGTQSPALLDLRMECLRRRLLEVDAALAATSTIERGRDVRTLDALEALSPIAECEDVRALQGPRPLPADPVLRTRIASLTGEYLEAKALHDIGRDVAGLAAAERVGAEIGKLGYRPLEAEVLHLIGRQQLTTGAIEAAEATLLRAVAAGQAGGMPAATARSWLDLIWIAGELRGRHDEAEKLGVVARGAVEDAGDPPDLVATLEDRLGVIAFDRGDMATARTRIERSLVLRERRYGPNDTEVAASLQHLALVDAATGDNAGALARQRRVAEIFEGEMGLDHPMTGQVINGLAGALWADGKLGEAIAAWRKSLAIAERTHGPSSYDAAAVRTSLALGLRDAGELPEALAQSERALRDFLAVHGEKHPSVGLYMINYGEILLAAGRHGEAARVMTQARETLERRHGADRPEVAEAWTGLGKVRAAAGDPRGAAHAFERALALLAGRGSADQVGAARLDLAEVLWRGGADRRRARALAAEVRATTESRELRARADALIASQ